MNLTFKEWFDHLRKREATAEKELQKIRKALQSSQEICDHEYKLVASSAHNEFHECKICGHRMVD